MSLKLDGLSWKFSYMLWNYKLEKEVLWWSEKYLIVCVF